jgi:hypothetical protein
MEAKTGGRLSKPAEGQGRFRPALLLGYNASSQTITYPPHIEEI